MGAGRILPVLILVGVVIGAHFALSWQGEQNGTVMIPQVLAFSKRVLPNSNVPIELPQTGIAHIDNYLAFMMTFFWMALDERNVRAHLQAMYLLGTLSGTWIIMLAEGHRRSYTFMFVTYFCELMGEFVGIGLFTPIWCVLHLVFTTPDRQSSVRKAQEDLSAPTRSLSALGYAILIGHIVPTAVMNHTKVDAKGLYSAQLWTIIRLFHPVFVLAAFTVFYSFQHIIFRGPADQPAKRLAGKRKLYQFSMLASGFGHILGLGVLFSSHWIEGWLKPEVFKALDIKTLLVPVPFWSQNPVTKVDFVTGVATFLQWDNICAASAIFLWAGSLYIEALVNHPAGAKVLDVLNFFVQSVGMTLLAGPVAGAAYILQERDELIVAHASVVEAKQKVEVVKVASKKK